MTLRRVPIHVARTIPRERARVWDELMTDGHPAWTHPDGVGRHVEGTPLRGLGACSVILTGPFPPFGLRSVWLSEVIDVNPGYSVTTHVHAGSWEHIETVSLADAEHRSTLATVRGWYSRPAQRDGDLVAAQAGFERLAYDFLSRAADWREPDMPQTHATAG